MHCFYLSLHFALLFRFRRRAPISPSPLCLRHQGNHPGATRAPAKPYVPSRRTIAGTPAIAKFDWSAPGHPQHTDTPSCSYARQTHVTSGHWRRHALMWFRCCCASGQLAMLRQPPAFPSLRLTLGFDKRKIGIWRSGPATASWVCVCGLLLFKLKLCDWQGIDIGRAVQWFP